MNLWPRDWNNQLERMKMRVDEDNGKAPGMVNGRYQKVWRFSSNEFWKNIGYLVSATTFGLGWSRLWDKEEVQNISGNNMKWLLISTKVDFMRFVYPILFNVSCFIL